MKNFGNSEPNVSGVFMRNQRLWDNDPQRADECALDAIANGGFDQDCISREVGDYEGQIFAIRKNFVTWDGRYSWRLNDIGREALAKANRPIPHRLPVLDSWHMSRAEYCAKTIWIDMRNGERRGPFLQIAKEVNGYAGCLAMSPLFSREDVLALRDFVNNWLEENK